MNHPENDFNQSLFAICQAMVSALDLSEVLDTIVDLSVETLKADTGSILLYDSGSDRLQMLASRGLPEEVVRRGHISRQGSPAEWVIEHNEPRILHGRMKKDGELDTIEKSDDLRSSIIVPLRAQGNVIGTLNLNRKDSAHGVFNEEDLNTLMILASQAAISIENARLHRENMQKARLAAVGQTVAGISHCIKNMLSGLRGGVGIMELAEKSGDWDTFGKGMKILRRNVDRIQYLVLDMLDFSRDKTPCREHVALPELIDDVFDTVTYKADQKSVHLRREVSSDTETVYIDPGQIFRCLLNLVENAVDAAIPSGAQILVRCNSLNQVEIENRLSPNLDPEELGQVIELSVIDNGTGIDEENQKNIFNPFFSTKASKGTGLGLAVTAKLVEEHGGRIILESEPGRGTAFHLIIPEKKPGGEQVIEQG